MNVLSDRRTKIGLLQKYSHRRASNFILFVGSNGKASSVIYSCLGIYSLQGHLVYILFILQESIIETL